MSTNYAFIAPVLSFLCLPVSIFLQRLPLPFWCICFLAILILNFKIPFYFVWLRDNFPVGKIVFFCSFYFVFSLSILCTPTVCGPLFKNSCFISYLVLVICVLCCWCACYLGLAFLFSVSSTALDAVGPVHRPPPFIFGLFPRFSSSLWLNTLCLAATGLTSLGSGWIIVWGGLEVWVNG